MTDLPYLDFPALKALAQAAANTESACRCCAINLESWTAVPLSFHETDLRDVGTLLEDPFTEPTFAEFHQAGSRYESAHAPIAPRYFPANRCTVSTCVRCGRGYLRYTEAGGYFVERRIRALLPALLIDAPL
ncbi:MAG: hypothetical protein V4632_14095 [Pseudomonadota bacterium]